MGQGRRLQKGHESQACTSCKWMLRSPAVPSVSEDPCQVPGIPGEPSGSWNTKAPRAGFEVSRLLGRSQAEYLGVSRTSRAAGCPGFTHLLAPGSAPQESGNSPVLATQREFQCLLQRPNSLLSPAFTYPLFSAQTTTAGSLLASLLQTDHLPSSLRPPLTLFPNAPTARFHHPHELFLCVTLSTTPVSSAGSHGDLLSRNASSLSAVSLGVIYHHVLSFPPEQVSSGHSRNVSKGDRKVAWLERSWASSDSVCAYVGGDRPTPVFLCAPVYMPMQHILMHLYTGLCACVFACVGVCAHAHLWVSKIPAATGDLLPSS